MKKIGILGLSLCLGLLFSSCNIKVKESTPNEDQTSSSKGSPNNSQGGAFSLSQGLETSMNPEVLKKEIKTKMDSHNVVGVPYSLTHRWSEETTGPSENGKIRLEVFPKYKGKIHAATGTLIHSQGTESIQSDIVIDDKAIKLTTDGEKTTSPRGEGEALYNFDHFTSLLLSKGESKAQGTGYQLTYEGNDATVVSALFQDLLIQPPQEGQVYLHVSLNKLGALKKIDYDFYGLNYQAEGELTFTNNQ